MKKLILLFFVVLLVGTITAAEWDNVKSYNEDTKTVTIENAFGLPLIGYDIVTIKLNTPLDYRVPLGYQKVAEFEINTFTNYSNAFKELELFDKKDDDKKFTRDYDYKILSYETVIVDDWKTECSNTWNETNDSFSNNCIRIKTGTHEEQKEVWTDLGLSDFKEGEIKTIGIFTNVEIGDRVEWIPNLFGVRIDEWATWTEDLNVGIISYWKLDESS